MTPNPTAAVNPSDESVALLAAHADASPIAMVNLLCYAGVGGREAYGRYAEVAAETIAACGGSLLLMSSVADSVNGWDTLVLVYYPRRAAYLDMQNDPAYAKAVPDRTKGLQARLLYPFALPDTGPHPVETNPGDVFVLHLIRWLNAASVVADLPCEGELLSRLPAGGPGLVADARWDEIRLVRHSSVAEARSESLEMSRHGSLDGVLTVITRPVP